MISAASRESEHPNSTANGAWAGATSLRRAASWFGCSGVPATNRRLPASSTSKASSAVIRSPVMAEDYAWDAPKFRTATGNQRHPGRPACPARALDDAVRAHGAGDQAHRVAYLALKQNFEKQGNHWIAKDNPADCGGGGSRSVCRPREQRRGS